jgi:glycosyltransferase involved in cell wall biosynthesis
MNLAGLVSVITPTFNSCRYLRRVVASVANQTVPVYEHIIIDDGSTDDTPRVLNELAAEYPHLHIIRQNRAGAAAARNRGIAVARGRYIAFLDVDDLWHEKKVENQVRFMEEQKCVFSYGDYEELDTDELHPVKRYFFPETIGHKKLIRGCPIGCLTAAYNQEVLGKRYMPLVKTGHDWGLWLELTRDGVEAKKYPGLSASYMNGKKTLSSKKLNKALNVYTLYRKIEQLTPFAASMRTIEHSINSIIKKAGFLYRSDEEKY